MSVIEEFFIDVEYDELQEDAYEKFTLNIAFDDGGAPHIGTLYPHCSPQGVADMLRALATQIEHDAGGGLH